MSKVGTTPPHNLDTIHRLVAGNKQTYRYPWQIPSGFSEVSIPSLLLAHDSIHRELHRSIFR